MELSQRGRIASAEPGGRRKGRGGEGRGLGGGGRRWRAAGVVTSREPLPKSGLLSLGREAPRWHTASAEKLESSVARSAAVLGRDNEKDKVAVRSHELC